MTDQAQQTQSSQNTENSGGGVKFDWKAKASSIWARAFEIMTKPEAVWPKIRAEATPIKEIYMEYLVYLAALPAIGMLIGMSIVGVPVPVLGRYRSPFFGELITQVVTYALQLALIYAAAVLIQKVSVKFQGRGELLPTFQLLAYSMTPGFLVGILFIIPGLGIIMALGGFYGIYIFYKGVPEMTGVSEANRPKFVAASFGVMLGCAIVLAIVVSVF